MSRPDVYTFLELRELGKHGPTIYVRSDRIESIADGRGGALLGLTSGSYVAVREEPVEILGMLGKLMNAEET